MVNVALEVGVLNKSLQKHPQAIVVREQVQRPTVFVNFDYFFLKLLFALANCSVRHGFYLQLIDRQHLLFFELAMSATIFIRSFTCLVH